MKFIIAKNSLRNSYRRMNLQEQNYYYNKNHNLKMNGVKDKQDYSSKIATSMVFGIGSYYTSFTLMISSKK